MGDSQISLGRGNRRAFISGLRVGGNGNKKDQVGEGTETGEGERVCCRRVQNFGTGEYSRSLYGGLQLRLLVIANKFPELVILCDQIGAWLNCHQKGVIQKLV